MRYVRGGGGAHATAGRITMRALLCEAFDGVDSLKLADVPAPQPAAGEVLVDVHAAAISFMDTLMASGKYQMKPTLPYVPGTDAAGVVAAVGEGVTRFAVGDRVACSGWYGAYAEQMVAPEAWVSRLPDSVDFVIGSTVRHCYGTAQYGLVTSGHLQSGETVFVSGAAGGVGLAAVDLGHSLGAHVIAGVGSVDKEAIVRDRGAAEVVNYRTENLRERIKALTPGRGVDVFFDNVGGEVFTTMTRLMNWGGRMLPIGFASGEIPSVPVNLLLLKNCSVVGAFYGAWSQRFPAESAVADAQLFSAVGAGRLRPLVCEAVPLEDSRRAFELATSRRAQGRVVLLVR